jgi:DNA-binding response OmpR family regulator
VDLVLCHELSGLDLCSDARYAGVSTSVIVLSVEESDAARLSAIDAGADDYVPKTTSVQELRARILLAHKRPRLRPSQSTVLSDKERTLSAAEHRFLDLLRTRGEVTLASAAEVVLGRRDAGSIRALYKVVDKVRR